MRGHERRGPAVFLIGSAAALAEHLEAAGLTVLGQVASLDLFFPISQHCRAEAVVLAECGGPRGPAEAVAQVRVLAPAAVIAVLAHGGTAELTRAGADHVFLPPFEGAEIAAVLAGACRAGGGGEGRTGWEVAAPAPGAAEPQALKQMREAAWRRREAVPSGEASEAPARKGIVLLLGAKGGVGTSFLAANLAAVVALGGGSRPLLADLCGRGDAAAHLGLAPATSLLDLLPHLPALGRGDGGAHCQVEPLTGLHVLPGPARPDLDELIQLRHVEQFLDWVRAEYRVAFVDAPYRPPDERLLACARRAETLFLVSTAEATSLRQVRPLLDWLEARGAAARERAHLILCRIGPDAAPSPAELERLTGLRPYAALPEDRRAVEQAVLSGRPLALRQPEHPLSIAIRQVAGRFLPGTAPAVRPPSAAASWAAAAEDWLVRLLSRRGGVSAGRR